MALIKEGGHLPMKKVIVDANGDVEISDADGKTYNKIPAYQTRQATVLIDSVQNTVIQDCIMEVEYFCKTNELEDDSAIISDVDPATDKVAVETYLGAFIGKHP